MEYPLRRNRSWLPPADLSLSRWRGETLVHEFSRSARSVRVRNHSSILLSSMIRSGSTSQVGVLTRTRYGFFPFRHASWGTA